MINPNILIFIGIVFVIITLSILSYLIYLSYTAVEEIKNPKVIITPVNAISTSNIGIGSSTI